MDERIGRRSWMVGALLFLGSVLATAGTVTEAPAAGETLEVTAAEWRSDRSQLRLEGVARNPDSVVMVRDADTMALLGSAAVRADGKWMLKIRNPKTVPCRARAEADGKIFECDVANAPSPDAPPIAARGPVNTSQR